jgi:hypothetical protein
MNFDSLIIHGLSSIAVYFDFYPWNFKIFFVWNTDMQYQFPYILYQNFFLRSNTRMGIKFNTHYFWNYIATIFGNIVFCTIKFQKNISAQIQKIYLEFIEVQTIIMKVSIIKENYNSILISSRLILSSWFSSIWLDEFTLWWPKMSYKISWHYDSKSKCLIYIL